MTAADYQRRADALAALEAAVAAIRKSDELRLVEAKELRVRIVGAFDAGVQGTEIARATGLSRTTVYEMRNWK